MISTSFKPVYGLETGSFHWPALETHFKLEKGTGFQFDLERAVSPVGFNSFGITGMASTISEGFLQIASFPFPMRGNKNGPDRLIRAVRDCFLSKRLYQQRLLDLADAADGGAAVGALALGDGLAVLGVALLRVGHDLLRLALDAVSLDRHDSGPPLCSSRQQLFNNPM